MAGLFDLIQSGDPAVNNGLLNFGLSLLQSKGSFGNAVGRAGQVAQLGARDYRQQEELLKRTRLNDELLQMQLEQQQRQVAEQARMQELAKQYYQTPQQQAMAKHGGPFMAAAKDAPNMPGGFDRQGYMQALYAEGKLPMALQMEQLLQKQAPQLTNVPEGGRIGYMDPATGKWVQVAEGAPRSDKESKEIQTLKLIYGEGTPEYMAALKQLGQKMTTHQPAPKQEIHLGQKGFDNTLKLRGDFRSEPIYKAHQEMQSAYSQIVQSLKQASPAGDLAGATKIMKLLDPGSVVRESELGMAMAASGLLDRMQNYASMVVNGTKLTPTQRKDFQTLADALFAESVKQYNTKRSEYKDIAERNQLVVPDVVGSPSVAPAGSGEWSMVKVP